MDSFQISLFLFYSESIFVVICPSKRKLASLPIVHFSISWCGKYGSTPSLTAICRRRMATSVSGGSGGRLRFAADAIHWSTVGINIRYRKNEMSLDPGRRKTSVVSVIG